MQLNIIQKITKYAILTLLSIPFIKPCRAQQQQNLSQQFIAPINPLSPNAASLGVYGNVPVSMYTGIPDIQVPVYDIKVGNLSIPISLSYHAGGVKVEDYSSSVGANWSLNAGGVINRQQRGNPDEQMIDNYAVYKPDFDQILDPAVSDATKKSIAQKYYGLGSTVDMESDIFNFSAGSLSGKFFMDPYGNAYCMPANKLKIQQDGRIEINGAYSQAIKRWTITDNNGVKYIFGSDLAGTASAQEITNSGEIGNDTVNSWYLSQIVTPGGDVVTFNYEPYTYTLQLNTSYSKYVYPPGAVQGFSNNTTVTYKALRVSNITFPNGKIVFVTGGNREDIPGDKVLDHISIYNAGPDQAYNLLKTYQLYNNNPANVPANQATDPTFRLRLDKVTMADANGQNIGSYTMSYNNFSSLPARNGGQDLWGFYNGLPSGGTLVPYYYLYNPDGTVQAILGDVNRGVNDTYNQYGTLSQITYPTGGTSQFQYESNRATVTDSRLINLVNSSPTTAPTGKSFTYQLENMTGTPVTATSGNFTVANVVPASSWSLQGHILSYGVTCPSTPNPVNPNYYSFPCFTATLSGTRTDGTPVNIPIQYFGMNVLVYPGTYHITITNSMAAPGGMAYVTVGWNETPTATQFGDEIEVGGLRIKSIANYDPVSNTTITKTYQYTYPGSTQSSGTIENLPVFIYNINSVIVNNNAYQDALAIASQSQSPLVTTQGSVIGYANVIETVDNGGILGKNNYTYTSDDIYLNDPSLYQDGGIAASEQFPFTPTTSNDWKRGLLKQKVVMANVNGTLNQALVTTSTYAFSGTNDINYKMMPNIKFTKEVSGYRTDNGIPQPVYDNVYSIYYNSTGSVNNDSNIEQVYDNTNYTTSASKVTSQTLDPLTLEKATASLVTSNKKTVIKQIKYPLNYTITTATDDATQGLAKLIAFNKVKEPVEILEISQQVNGDQYVTGGTICLYYKNKPEINKVLTLNIAQPVLLQSFQQSSVNSSGNFVYDSRYEERHSADRYTGKLTLAQETKNSNSTNTYLWDYNGQLPIATVTNADSLNVAYTSFEADGMGGWTIPSSTRDAAQAITGNRSYALSNGSISKAGLSTAQTYIVSYWTLNGTPYTITGTITGYPVKGATNKGWTYYEHRVTGQATVTISGSGNIDELRLYPLSAQMTTYTYAPLIGMSSSADAKGEITYYEYDAFQRLMNIKDKDGNIVKHTDYHYQQ